jgi:hypothetical protein
VWGLSNVIEAGSLGYARDFGSGLAPTREQRACRGPRSDARKTAHLVAPVIGDDSRGFQRYRKILRATRSGTNSLHGFMNNGRFGADGPDMKEIGVCDRRDCIQIFLSNVREATVGDDGRNVHSGDTDCH